jgi:hypothetical protein
VQAGREPLGLRGYGITTPLVAYHEHSSEGVRERMIARIRAGEALARPERHVLQVADWRRDHVQAGREPLGLRGEAEGGVGRPGRLAWKPGREK